jgi:hypothetical protein
MGVITPDDFAEVLLERCCVDAVHLPEVIFCMSPSSLNLVCAALGNFTRLGVLVGLHKVCLVRDGKVLEAHVAQLSEKIRDPGATCRRIMGMSVALSRLSTG